MAGKAAGEAATAAGASSSLRATLNKRNVGASWGGDGKKAEAARRAAEAEAAAAADTVFRTAGKTSTYTST